MKTLNGELIFLGAKSENRQDYVLLSEAQAEIARLKEELKEKNESGCCIVEHGYRMAAEHELAAFKERWNKDGVIIDDLKRDNQNLQSALDVAVEGLEQAKVDMEEDVFNAFHIKQTLDKIKQIRGEK